MQFLAPPHTWFTNNWTILVRQTVFVVFGKLQDFLINNYIDNFLSHRFFILSWNVNNSSSQVVTSFCKIRQVFKLRCKFLRVFASSHKFSNVSARLHRFSRTWMASPNNELIRITFQLLSFFKECKLFTSNLVFGSFRKVQCVRPVQT